jgi:1,4-alpha-glucan branching enzyme
LENERREARYVARDTAGRPRLYTAQWNDPLHHALHVAATGERSGYYEPFAADPFGALGRALTASPAPGGSVNFLQNHDQIGNRAMGDRLSMLAGPQAVEASLAILLLSPQVPLLFMGEEWGTERPFTFFCDFHDELANKIREGRRAEFAAFPEFADPAKRARIPDPNAEDTFRAAVLDWSEPSHAPYSDRLAFVAELLRLRRAHVTPLIAHITASGFRLRDHTIIVEWLNGPDVALRLTAEIGRRWRLRWEAGRGTPVFVYG